nr:unnamed protein product [Callosobruchus analis]
MELVRLVDPVLERRTRCTGVINVELQIFVCLEFYATGAFQLTVADHINILVSSACKLVKDVTHRIAALRPDHIKMPQVEMDALGAKFQATKALPGVLGAIDRTHIKITSPGGVWSERLKNRKGFYSINIQAVCDADLMIRDINARWPGSTHDSTIFQDSQLSADLMRGMYGRGRYLIGDSGHACKAYLLIPVAYPPTDAEERFNIAHASTRNTIESCFGILKRRFPCLAYGLRNKIDLSVAIIVACSVLHNFALMHRDIFEEDIRETPEVIIIIIIYFPFDNIHCIGMVTRRMKKKKNRNM